MTDTIINPSENGAADGPLLPSLPPAPVLPPASSAHVEAPTRTPIASPPPRPNLAANAPYGVMPVKPRASEPSPAALRAAEARRQAKKRRKTRRITLLVIAIAVAAAAGPPTVRWIGDGLAKAGTTEPETPPPTDAAD